MSRRSIVPNPPDERLWQLLLRYLECDLSEQDGQELARRLQDNQNARNAFQDLCAQDLALADLFRSGDEQGHSHSGVARLIASGHSTAEQVQHG
jgi:hypothetical protein